MIEVWLEEVDLLNKRNFEFERNMRNTRRLQEKTFLAPVIGMICVQKALFGEDVLVNVRVTVEWE